MSRYKFSIDEPAPSVNPPGDFHKLVQKVKIQTPWYTQVWNWAGIAGFTAVLTTAIWVMRPGTLDSRKEGAEMASTRITQKKDFREESGDAPIAAVEANTAIKAHKPLNGQSIFRKTPEQGWYQEPEILDENQDLRLMMETAIPAPIAEYAVSPSWTSLIRVKYDTLTVSIASLPSWYIVGNSKINIQQGSIVYETGKAVSGNVKLLYREISRPEDMIAASMFMKSEDPGKPTWLENNGAFEIRLEQDGRPLKINRQKPLVIQFMVNSSSENYTGYAQTNSNEYWRPMYTGLNTPDAPDINKTITDRMMVKRSFFAWVSDIFHRREIQWDSFERVNYQAVPTRYRTFEAAETGYYSSASGIGNDAMKTVSIQTVSRENQVLEPVLFQVFLNKNLVIKYPVKDGNTDIIYQDGDNFILIAAVEGSLFASVCPSRQILKKQNLTNGAPVSAEFILYRERIQTTKDLKMLIDSYSK